MTKKPKKVRFQFNSILPSLSRLTFNVLIKRRRLIELILIVGAVLLATVVSAWLFWSTPSIEYQEIVDIQLDKDRIDQLEFWIEERQSGSERTPLNVGRIPFSP